MSIKIPHIVILTCLAMMNSACDGDTARRIAKAVLAEDEQNTQTQPNNQPIQPAQPVQPIQQEQPTQPQVQAQLQPVQTQQLQPVQPQATQQQPQMVQQPQTIQAQQIADTSALPPKPATTQPTEHIVRKRAYVLTQHGSNVMVRNAPGRGGRKVGYLYDSEEIWVVGETNQCETINNLYGCWVKVVDANGLTGYSFGAYLQY